MVSQNTGCPLPGNSKYSFTSPVGECSCNPTWNLCLTITIPTWTAIVSGNGTCSQGVTRTGLMKNYCVEDSTFGRYMLFTYPCVWNDCPPSGTNQIYWGGKFNWRYRDQVVHELLTDCNPGCLDCANWWTLHPSDCKCAGKFCVTAYFSSNAYRTMGSLLLSLIFLVSALF
eukprot:TRINITY_DN3358_c0_g1_i5.p1 TRINITY_DN3358_c0_g1~~TRINITY_DN3358_c0_g1_i5.p1  ORF type:complete len:171 (-),score=6.20 TRINITY_DN3358_c0_g1_i5:23-535(-)